MEQELGWYIHVAATGGNAVCANWGRTASGGAAAGLLSDLRAAQIVGGYAQVVVTVVV